MIPANFKNTSTVRSLEIKKRKYFFLFQVTLHIAYVHAFVNPTLFLTLHRGLRQGMTDVCCGCCEGLARWILNITSPGELESLEQRQQDQSCYQTAMNLPSPPSPPQPTTSCDLADVAHLRPPLPPSAKHHRMVGRLQFHFEKKLIIYLYN